jgi:hypothetical protein
MADRAVAAAGALPVRMNLPVPLQRPYAADPGTLTEWLVANTADLGRDAVLAVLAAMNAKYANVVDPLLPQERVDALLRELAEDILASEGLESFLTVTTPEGGTPTVITVSRLSRFRSGMGQTSPYDGNVYGFLGEVEEGQMPPLMKLPDSISLRQALAVREVVAAAEDELDAWYGEGPGNPRVPTQGDELVTELEGGLGVNVRVPLLQYLPMAWAPYFIAAQSPEVARRTLRRLTEGNLTDLQRQHTARLETWMRAACMRSGPVGANRYRSKLHMTWVVHRAVLDRSMTRWATRRLAPFLTAPAVVPPPPAAPAIALPGGAAGVAMHPPPGGAGGFGGAPYEGRETKVFSPLEHERIRLACGLDPANYDAGRPPIYAVFLAEGRSMVKVEAVLQKFLAPAPDDWDPIRLYVSQELVRDMKDLKLGWGNENAHDTCHRGISPFAVLQVSMDQQTKRRKTQERADRATYLSTEDVRALEAEPGCCPGSYYAMLTLLRRYIRLLTVLFGAGCSHLTEVQGIYQVLAEKVAVYETMSAELIAEILWRVFVDARECFSHLGPGLPESQLYSLRHDVRGCSLRVSINCPVALLLNSPSAAVVSQAGNGNALGGRSGYGGVSIGSATTMSTLTSSAPREPVPLIGGKRTNPTPIPEVVAIMQGLRAKRPGVDMNAVMRSEKLTIAEIGIGGKGACLDFMYFGECTRSGCSYEHGPVRNVSAGKRRDCVRRMTKAASGFLKNNPVG